MVTIDNGYPRGIASLVESCPGADVYPPDGFRLEWGPIFHRGRLDGTARVLVLGQDPAAHEAICRRILVGAAGQRLQGFLTKLGINRSYVMVNTFVYSVYGQHNANRHVDDDGIAAYRHRWLDALVRRGNIEAIATLGDLAERAYVRWKATAAGQRCAASHAHLLHPTYPESAAAAGSIDLAAGLERLCRSWNDALGTLRPVVTPDDPASAVGSYGTTITDADLTPIPAFDLPAGLPAWMRSLEPWAARTGEDADTKRATITVTVPGAHRNW